MTKGYSSNILDVLLRLCDKGKKLFSNGTQIEKILFWKSSNNSSQQSKTYLTKFIYHTNGFEKQILKSAYKF